MTLHQIPLHEALHRAHEELIQIVPPEDLRLPDGERLSSATYVHVHLPILAAAMQGYGFQDSALTDEARALAHLSVEDRWDYLIEGHEATARGSAWVRPHLSRATLEYIEGGTQFDSPFSQAAAYLPPANGVRYDGGIDRESYGVVTRSSGKDYLVPMDELDKGEIGAARRIIGLGAGLSNATSLKDALVGDPDAGINGKWSTRPMTSAANGPIMLVGIEWQGQASQQESLLAKNAAEKHRLIHDNRPDKTPTVMIPYTVPILPLAYGQGMG